jgi:hypothetical protein
VLFLSIYLIKLTLYSYYIFDKFYLNSSTQERALSYVPYFLFTLRIYKINIKQ